MTYRLVIAVLSVFVLLRMQDAFAAGTIQASFDCAKATSAVEKTICSDDGLAAMDREMAADFGKVLDTTTTRSRGAIIDEQRRWLEDLAERCNTAGDVGSCVRSKYSDWLRNEFSKLGDIGRVMTMIPRFPSLPTLSLNRDPGLCRRLTEAAVENFERPNDIDNLGDMPGPASRMSISGSRWIDLSEGGIGGQDAILILPGSGATKPGFGIVLQVGFRGSYENYSLFLIKAADLPRFENKSSPNRAELSEIKPFFDASFRSSVPFGLLRTGSDIYLAEQDEWKTFKLSKITGSGPPQTTCVVTYGTMPPIGRDFDRWIADIGQVQGQEGPNSGSGHFLDAHLGATSVLATRAAVRPADVILLALDELDRTGPREQGKSPERSKMGVELWGFAGPWNHVKVEHLEADSTPALAALSHYYVMTYGMTKDDAASAATRVTDAIWQASFSFDMFGDETERGKTTAAEIDADRREQADAFARSPIRSHATALIRTAILVGASKADIAALIAAGAELGNLSTSSEPALFFALERTEIAQLLIEKGANVNETNAFGKTALMYAAQFDLYDALELLLKARANVSAVTQKRPVDEADIEYNMSRANRSALMYAAENASRRVIERLIDAGADVHAVDSQRNGIAFYLKSNPFLRPSEKEAIERRLEISGRSQHLDSPTADFDP